MLIDCGQDKTRGREPQKRKPKMTTRKQITAEARKTIADAITKPQAIRAGLLIASCKMWSRNEASAVGCAKSANDIANALEAKYPGCATLAGLLAGLVANRDWESLWIAARREVYGNLA